MSEKYREIEVWVSRDFLHSLNHEAYTVALNPKKTPFPDGLIKAKISILAPEKKIEITESQFFEMVRDFKIDAEMQKSCVLGSYREPMNKWREKLFGEKGN